MWNLTNTSPAIIEAEVFTRVPDEFAIRTKSEWSDANKFGVEVSSFLEGPSFDRAGNLYVTDIPFGRIFRITPERGWQLVTQYDGWPNGIAIHQDGRLFIADYRRGLLVLDPTSGKLETLLGHRNSESFKGPNDLTFDRDDRLYFTDQGQTGLHDPSGRVYRLDTEERTLYVAMTRANRVWRSPLMGDGTLSKIGAFRTFFGASGPDGMAVDEADNLVVAHASLGCAFVMNRHGEVTHIVKSPAGSTVTNVAYQPGTSSVYMTESETATILRAQLHAPGKALFSRL